MLKLSISTAKRINYSFSNALFAGKINLQQKPDNSALASINKQTPDTFLRPEAVSTPIYQSIKKL